MNTQLLKQHISTYKKWLNSNNEQAHQEQIKRRSLSSKYQAYTKDRILSVTKEDIYEYIAPLWAMLIWGNKQYVINKLIDDNGLEQIRKQLANFVWGADKLEIRWDEFRKKVKGMGPAMMSELLCKTHPKDCMLWNRRALVAFNYLEIPNLPRYDYQFTGKTYAYLCEQAKTIAEIMNEEYISADLLTVDYFIWQELQVQSNLSKITFGKISKEVMAQVEATPIKEAEFIHNDIRDKLAEIGR
jgi:hypothetical protein